MTARTRALILSIFIGMVAMILAPATAQTVEQQAITYKAYVDNNYGFYKVHDITTQNSSGYANHTLNIHTGDTIIWINDAISPEERLTIISTEGLWNNTTARLRWSYQQYKYTFNESGTFTFSVKEYPRMARQTVHVNELDRFEPTTSTWENTTKNYRPPTFIPTNEPKPTAVKQEPQAQEFPWLALVVSVGTVVVMIGLFIIIKKRNEQK